MKEITVNVIEKLLDENLNTADIAKIMSDDFISDALENGADFEIEDSVEKFGKNNSDNELYEKNGDFKTWGEFLLAVPGAWENIKLPSGKVFCVIK